MMELAKQIRGIHSLSANCHFSSSLKTNLFFQNSFVSQLQCIRTVRFVATLFFWLQWTILDYFSIIHIKDQSLIRFDKGWTNEWKSFTPNFINFRLINFHIHLSKTKIYFFLQLKQRERKQIFFKAFFISCRRIKGRTAELHCLRPAFNLNFAQFIIRNQEIYSNSPRLIWLFSEK